MAAFEAKQRALQGAAQRKDEQLKNGFYQARQAMEQAQGPIVQEVVEERGANIVVDKQAVVFATASSVDIAQEVINRLQREDADLQGQPPRTAAGAAQQQGRYAQQHSRPPFLRNCGRSPWRGFAK